MCDRTPGVRLGGAGRVGPGFRRHPDAQYARGEGRSRGAARAAERAVVALDFDGTLADIVPDPEQARAHPGAVPALVRLAPHLAAVAVVTGRPAGVAVRYGGFAGVPGLENLVVLGHYGAERWDAHTGTVHAPADHPGVTALRAELPGFLDRIGAWRGTWIEDKGRAIAVHTRRTEDPDAAFEALRAPLAELADRHGLMVEPGPLRPRTAPAGHGQGRRARRVSARDRRGLASSTRATTSATWPPSPPSTPCARRASRASSSPAPPRRPRPSSSPESDLTAPGPGGVVSALQALTSALPPPTA